MNDITIGHDGELFAQDEHGNVKSVIGLIGGTKEAPDPCKFGALQEDNVMAELNIVPARTVDEFVHHTDAVMGELTKRLAKYKLKPLIVPHAEFAPEDLNNIQAQTFGCMPDYDAWNRCENEPVDLSATNSRYAGGHIHIGVPFANEPDKILHLIQFLDVTLGAGLLAQTGISKRTEAYGRWGAHRPTPYGVEYRMIDNTWLADKKLMKWVYKVANWAAKNIAYGAKRRIMVRRSDLEDLLKQKDLVSLRKVANMHLHPELRIKDSEEAV